MAIEFKELPVGEDPHILVEAEKHGITASMKITLHFEGDWSNIYDDKDETEDDARAATAAEVFKVILSKFE